MHAGSLADGAEPGAGGGAGPGAGVGRDVSWSLLARAGATVASLAGQVLVARWLGPAGNGLLAAATTVLALAMLAADLGVNTSISRALAAAYYDDPRAVRRVVVQGLVLKLGLTLAVAAALFAGAGTIAGWLGAEAALAVVVGAAAVQLLLDNLATFAFRGLQGLHRPGLLAVAQAISGISSPLLAAAIVFVGFGPAGAVAGRAAGAGLAAAFALAALLAVARAVATSGQVVGPPDHQTTRPLSGASGGVGEIVRFARQIFWVQVAYLVFFRLDQGMIQLFLGTETLGLYNPASAIVEKCLLPVVSIAAVAGPHFAAAGDAARLPALRSLLARSLRWTVLLYVPAAAGLAIVAPEAVRAVFGPAYAGAAPILRAFADALVVLAPATLLGGLIDYLGLARARAAAFALAAAADLAQNALLIPRLGPIGAVVSLVATMGPLVAFYLVTLARRLGADLRPLAADLGRAAAGAAVMSAAILGARPFLGGAPGLVALVLLGLGTYAGTLRALGVRDFGLRRGARAA